VEPVEIAVPAQEANNTPPAVESIAVETRRNDVPVSEPAYSVASPEAVPASPPAVHAVSAPASEPLIAAVAEPAPYTSVASEERVVEYAAKPVIPSAPVARDPIVLPNNLTQIETDPEKLRIASSKVAPLPPARPPRQRPPLPPVSNEPLIQVETRK
jgi:ribonuclease E